LFRVEVCWVVALCGRVIAYRCFGDTTAFIVSVLSPWIDS